MTKKVAGVLFATRQHLRRGGVRAVIEGEATWRAGAPWRDVGAGAVVALATSRAASSVEGTSGGRAGGSVTWRDIALALVVTR
jgi:hypothetical protein